MFWEKLCLPSKQFYVTKIYSTYIYINHSLVCFVCLYAFKTRIGDIAQVQKVQNRKKEKKRLCDQNRT